MSRRGIPVSDVIVMIVNYHRIWVKRTTVSESTLLEDLQYIAKKDYPTDDFRAELDALVKTGWLLRKSDKIGVTRVFVLSGGCRIFRKYSVDAINRLVIMLDKKYKIRV